MQKGNTPWQRQRQTARGHPTLGLRPGRATRLSARRATWFFARRQAGVVHPVKINGLERDCALALAKKARRAALTYKNGYSCRVCGGGFERRGPLVEQMARHPPDAVPTVKERPKRSREEAATNDGNALKCRWRAKKCTGHA
ncbi:hypothetical protein TRVL_10056 [Trypanosoma vivax]|nr:hypothetical protein TRVL_10056 [Trypanosoma vivax]